MDYAKRLVPWQSWEEWMYVRNLLYSMDYNEQMKGISIVKVWNCRCSAIPIAVQSSSLFTELLIKMDYYSKNQYIETEPFEISTLTYAASMALIRMVNGIIDAEQKGVYAKSVNVIAEELNIPREFVDLRHRCTHGDIPSFDVLYSSLQQGKRWLYENYWQVSLISNCLCIETTSSHRGAYELHRPAVGSD